MGTSGVVARRAEPAKKPKDLSNLAFPLPRPAALRLAPILAITAAMALSGCSSLPFFGKKTVKADLSYQERPVEALYAAGAEKLDQHRWNEATQYFDEVERQHPYSEWSRRSILMTAYARYQNNQYDDAVEAADRFISLYPGNPSTPYAYYLKSQCYFEQIDDVGRDQGYTEQAMATLNEVMKRYPDTPYAVDAKLKVDMVSDQLAGKEMTVGRWYLRQNQPIAAIGRFRTVIDRYQTTSHTPEALYRLVEANLTLGVMDEAKKDGAVLGFNFPGDPWYADAYALLTLRGLRPLVPPTGKAHQGVLPRISLPRLPHFGKAPPPPKV